MSEPESHADTEEQGTLSGMAEPDDAAIRLYRILRRLVDDPPASNLATSTALQRVTGLTSGARAYGAMIALLGEVEGGLRALDGKHDVQSFLFLLEPIDAWLSNLSLKGEWGHEGAADERAVEALKVCSNLLQLYRPVVATDTETLAPIRDDAASLLNDVISAAAELDNDLRLFLVRNLHAIIRAIDTYNVGGSAALRDVIQRATGDFAEKRPDTKGGKAKRFLKSFVAVCQSVIIVTTAAEKLAELPRRIEDSFQALDHQLEPKALPPGPPTAKKASPSSGARKRSTTATPASQDDVP